MIGTLISTSYKNLNLSLTGSHTYNVQNKYLLMHNLNTICPNICWFVCVEVLRPSQPNRVMLTTVSLPNHMFTGQALSSKRLTSIVHILSPETDNCLSWISGRERMAIENISWSISTKECCWLRWRLNPWPPGIQLDGASNWATEVG